MDADERLGGHLQAHVETYVSVVGINYGVPWCECNDTSGATCVTFGGVDFNASCSQLNGIRCGSAYLNDINGAHPSTPNNHYEGENVFSILTTDDDAIGYVVCGDKVGVSSSSSLCGGGGSGELHNAAAA